MASQFAPDALGIIDDGAAPVIFIDGVAAHAIIGGMVRVALFANQPIVEPGAEPTDPCKHFRVVVLKLIYSLETQALMRRQLVEHLGDSVRPSDLAGVHH